MISFNDSLVNFVFYVAFYMYLFNFNLNVLFFRLFLLIDCFFTKFGTAKSKIGIDMGKVNKN